jgi:hypothetical protein
MSDIFISYASEDRPRAQMLAQTLEDRGWSTFWDRTIPIGKTWRETIAKELADARCVIVLWSTTSIISRWVQEEAEDAERRGILVPVLIESVHPPIGFRSLQAADLVNWNPPEQTQTFRRLLADTEKLIGTPPKKVDSQTEAEAERNAEEGRKQRESKVEIEAEPRRAEEAEVQRTWRPSKAHYMAALLAAFMVLGAAAAFTGINRSHGPAEPRNAGPQVAQSTGATVPQVAPSTATTAAATEVNLLASEQGGHLLQAPDENWRKITSGKEDEWVSITPPADAVYAFKDKKSAVFGKFATLIKETNGWNPKEVEILAADDWLGGTFRTVAKCALTNALLIETPYQPCVFTETTARFVKIRVLSSYYPGGSTYLYQIQLLGHLVP